MWRSVDTIDLVSPNPDPSGHVARIQPSLLQPTSQILSLEMHRGLRPLGAASLLGATGGGGEVSSVVAEEGVEGSRAAAKAVEKFVRENIEEYFGYWVSTYTLFSLDPRLVRRLSPSFCPLLLCRASFLFACWDLACLGDASASIICRRHSV